MLKVTSSHVGWLSQKTKSDKFSCSSVYIWLMEMIFTTRNCKEYIINGCMKGIRFFIFIYLSKQRKKSTNEAANTSILLRKLLYVGLYNISYKMTYTSPISSMYNIANIWKNSSPWERKRKKRFVNWRWK